MGDPRATVSTAPMAGWTRSAPGVLFVAVAIGVAAVSRDAEAQERSFEISYLVPVVRFVSIDPSLEWQKLESERRGLPVHPFPRWTEAGGGLRFGYRLNQHVTMEVEGSLFLTYSGGGLPDLEPGDTPFRGWEKIQVLAGLTVGRQVRRIRVFAKGRPGVVRFGHFPVIEDIHVGDNAILIVTGDGQPGMSVALDLGGGAEFPWKRFVVRGDVGDTMIRYRPAPFDLNPSYVRHNLQINMSVGIRF